MTYHLDVDSELRFEVEHGAEVQLEVINCGLILLSNYCCHYSLVICF